MSTNETHNSVTISTDTSHDNEKYVEEVLSEVDEHNEKLEHLNDSELPEKEEEPEVEAEEEPEVEEKETGDFDAFAKEFEETGELTKESFDKLEGMGVPRAYVEQYLAGISAERGLAEAQAFAITGGEDGYKEMLEWCGGNLSDSDIDTFNVAVNEPESRNKAIKKMHERYLEDVGTGGNLLMGETPVQHNSNSYESFEQLVKDQQDPRYDTDPAYRRMVMQKLSRSDI